MGSNLLLATGAAVILIAIIVSATQGMIPAVLIEAGIGLLAVGAIAKGRKRSDVNREENRS